MQMETPEFAKVDNSVLNPNLSVLVPWGRRSVVSTEIC